MAPSAKGRLAPPADPVSDPDTPSQSPPEEAPATDVAACPRCGGKLTNPAGLGWCSACGYCRSLEDEAKPAVALAEPAAPQKPSTLGAAEFGEAMKHMPGWLWPLLGGSAVVACASVAADQLLPEECLARAVWSATQMVLSLVGLIAAQLWAVMLVGASEDGLGAKDVILPGRLWRAAFRRLPATRKPAWLGAWCLTALICGAAVIGGFNYWLELVKANRLRRLVDAAAKSVSQEPADRGFTAPESASQPARAGEDSRKVAQCVVIGYQTDGKDLTGLVLATMDGERLKFVGVVEEGISAALRKDLMSRLKQLGQQESLIPGLKLKGTTWVKPGVFCDVSHAGADKQGQLEAAKFKKLMD
jgi:hypothetical protein